MYSRRRLLRKQLILFFGFSVTGRRQTVGNNDKPKKKRRTLYFSFNTPRCTYASTVTASIRKREGWFSVLYLRLQFLLVDELAVFSSLAFCCSSITILST